MELHQLSEQAQYYFSRLNDEFQFIGMPGEQELFDAGLVDRAWRYAVPGDLHSPHVLLSRKKQPMLHVWLANLESLHISAMKHHKARIYAPCHARYLDTYERLLSFGMLTFHQGKFTLTEKGLEFMAQLTQREQEHGFEFGITQ